jgi:uncharacterized protein YrrD
MMNSVSRLNGSTITATDGRIGHVIEVYFDDQAWAIRYLVVDTGTWLSGREVLISPYAVQQPIGLVKNLDVTLTCKQVEDSPHIDTHQPISRRHEREYLDYYAYPAYWGGDALWAMSAMPLVPPALQAPLETQEERARLDADVPAEDVHLRSSANVTGYDIQASDDSIGHVADFVFDDESWAIRYLVIDTRNWWPGGKKVLVGTHWIESIDWADRTVQVRLTRDQIKDSPKYEEGQPIDRDYEKRLHDAYDRKGYWD